MSSLVEERANARARGDYDRADSLKQIMHEITPNGMQLQLKDVPRKEGGGSTWKVIRKFQQEPMEGPTVLHLAHAALGLAIASSSSDRPDSSQDLNTLVHQAKKRLEQTELVLLELNGRKAADAAFWFALAGTTDQELFDLLTDISGKELARYGTRSSCRGKDVWHVLERLAAAGIRFDALVEQAAITALESKTNGKDNVNYVPADLLNFHSDRCLLMIWKFSTRQRKQRAFLQSALQHWNQHRHDAGEATATLDDSVSVKQQEIQWSQKYKDPSKPLVIDIGCGMGVSLLGLAQRDNDHVDDNKYACLGVNLVDCNFAGVDLSGLAIGYARGLSHRWGLGDRLNFFVDNAESFTERVLDSYPGPVRLCLVQFPTPYRFQVSSKEEKRGNTQLPVDMTSGFMVTKRLLELIHTALRPSSGRLLIQSNVEDVAVFLRQTACDEVGFECVESKVLQATEPETLTRIPKRTLDWISMGGIRAEGKGWGSSPLLPRIGRTETEVACMVFDTPVHRCLLCVSSIEVGATRY